MLESLTVPSTPVNAVNERLFPSLARRANAPAAEPGTAPATFRPDSCQGSAGAA